VQITDLDDEQISGKGVLSKHIGEFEEQSIPLNPSFAEFAGSLLVSELEIGYNTREWQHAAFSYSFGQNFDRDFHMLEGEVNFKLTRDFSASYGLERVLFDPDPENESTWIHVLRATNYFTNDLFVKLFYQINTAIDKSNVQVLFVYRFQPPFGSVQIAYQKGTGEFGERGVQGNTLFLKFAYMF